MLQRDLLKAEIERLAQVLAKILRLKTSGLVVEAKQLLDETLEKTFGLPVDFIYQDDISTFEKWVLTNDDLEAEKLESLSNILYQELEENNPNNKAIAVRLDLIFDTLTNKHKILHLQNISRQASLKKYF